VQDFIADDDEVEQMLSVFHNLSFCLKAIHDFP
jgi:hypothetical protein